MKWTGPQKKEHYKTMQTIAQSCIMIISPEGLRFNMVGALRT